MAHLKYKLQVIFDLYSSWTKLLDHLNYQKVLQKKKEIKIKFVSLRILST